MKCHLWMHIILKEKRLSNTKFTQGMPTFSSFILGSHIFMNVSNLFLCSGNEIGFKFICHKYGMYSLIFNCGESFLCCRVTYTAAVIKMFVWFSLLYCLPVLKHYFNI